MHSTSCPTDGASGAKSANGGWRLPWWFGAFLASVGSGMIALAVVSPGGTAAVVALLLAPGYVGVAGLVMRTGATHPIRWAWVAWLLTLSGLAAGVSAIELIGDLLDQDLWSSAGVTFGWAVVASLGFWALSLVPSVVGTLFGLRAARTMRAAGILVTITNGLTLALIVVLMVSDLASLSA